MERWDSIFGRDTIVFWLSTADSNCYIFGWLACWRIIVSERSLLNLQMSWVVFFWKIGKYFFFHLFFFFQMSKDFGKLSADDSNLYFRWLVFLRKDHVWKFCQKTYFMYLESVKTLGLDEFEMERPHKCACILKWAKMNYELD